MDLTPYNHKTNPPADYTPLPPGEYTVEIVGIDTATPKKEPRGTMLRLRYKVLLSEYTGKHLTDYVTLVYPSNSNYEDLGRARLKSVAQAAIGGDAKDTENSSGHG